MIFSRGPQKQVLVISTILQHRNVTYKDILDADLVVVSFSFLVYVCAPLSEVVLDLCLTCQVLSFFFPSSFWQQQKLRGSAPKLSAVEPGQ